MYSQDHSVITTLLPFFGGNPLSLDCCTVVLVRAIICLLINVCYSYRFVITSLWSLSDVHQASRGGSALKGGKDLSFTMTTPQLSSLPSQRRPLPLESWSTLHVNDQRRLDVNSSIHKDKIFDLRDNTSPVMRKYYQEYIIKREESIECAYSLCWMCAESHMLGMSIFSVNWHG